MIKVQDGISKLDIKGTNTEKNLMKAYVGETIATSRYTYYAKVAQKEGYEQIAAIFLETAEQEKSHAKTFYRFVAGASITIHAEYPVALIGNTSENLRSAIDGEIEESEYLYKSYELTALEEGFKDIATKLKVISKVEKFHADRFQLLLDNLTGGMVFKKGKKVKWMCRKCGFIHESENAPRNCPACDHPQAYFEILAENY
jgi:rubrerythrin